MGLIGSSPTGSPLGLLESVVSQPGAGGLIPASGEGGPGAGDGERISLQIFPWWLYGPAGTRFFYVDSGVQTIAAGASDVALLNSSNPILKGELGVIVAISLLIQAPTVVDNFFYTLKRNGGPVPGLQALRNFPVAAAFSLRELSGYVIRLDGGDVTSWSITNNGAVARDVSVSYIGWAVPQSEVDRIQMGVQY